MLVINWYIFASGFVNRGAIEHIYVVGSEYACWTWLFEYIPMSSFVTIFEILTLSPTFQLPIAILLFRVLEHP